MRQNRITSQTGIPIIPTFVSLNRPEMLLFKEVSNLVRGAMAAKANSGGELHQENCCFVFSLGNFS